MAAKTVYFGDDKIEIDREGNAVYFFGKTEVSEQKFLKRHSSGIRTVGLPRWNRPSWSLGGRAEDRDKLAETLRKKGVPTYVNREGDPVPTSARHQRKIAKALGYYNPDDNA